ncbi:unnamed protein product, partial [Mesorhabditis belari]|uniref:Uncharacterized protein n=1 Tax=Mesorhabditis belari TaxID=2138241 RepID=A0AAF3EJF4_9BILA
MTIVGRFPLTIFLKSTVLGGVDDREFGIHVDDVEVGDEEMDVEVRLIGLRSKWRVIIPPRKPTGFHMDVGGTNAGGCVVPSITFDFCSIQVGSDCARGWIGCSVFGGIR